MITEKMKWFLEQNGIDHSQMDYHTASKAIKALKEGVKLQPTQSQGSSSHLSVPDTFTASMPQTTYHHSYNTPDKETLIVRQSCLKAAIEFTEETKQESFSVERLLKLAEEFEKWVWR